MLVLGTVVIMLLVAYAFLREGFFTAVTMCVNVFAAGLVAFNFFEPLADLIDPLIQTSPLTGYEDAVCLVLLFTATLGLLRWATNSMAPAEVSFPPALLRGGAAVMGLVTGYLVSGFLACVFQTLPLHRQSVGLHYDAKEEPRYRKYLPPDRVWLALMYRAGAYAFSGREDEEVADPGTAYERYLTFDKAGNFLHRYARYRRLDDNGSTRTYQGETRVKPLE